MAPGWPLQRARVVVAVLSAPAGVLVVCVCRSHSVRAASRRPGLLRWQRCACRVTAGTAAWLVVAGAHHGPLHRVPQPCRGTTPLLPLHTQPGCQAPASKATSRAAVRVLLLLLLLLARCGHGSVVLLLRVQPVRTQQQVPPVTQVQCSAAASGGRGMHASPHGLRW